MSLRPGRERKTGKNVQNSQIGSGPNKEVDDPIYDYHLKLKIT